jgi:hypothetical protein
MMAVPIQAGNTFVAGNPLFEGQYVAPFSGPVYGSLDGKRFLMIKRIQSNKTTSPPQLVVVLNGLEELKQRVPVH